MMPDDPWRSFEERTFFAVSEVASMYEEPAWRSWAEAFLSGADRTDKSASEIARYTRDLAGITDPLELVQGLGLDADLDQEAIGEAALRDVTGGADNLGMLSRMNMAVAAIVAEYAALVFHPERQVQPAADFRAHFEGFFESTAVHVAFRKKKARE